MCDGAVSTLWTLYGWAIERRLRVTDFPEGRFAYLGEAHNEVRFADVVTQYDGRTGQGRGSRLPRSPIVG